MDDGRGELGRIVGEAVVLLQRQRARGRARLTLSSQLAAQQVEEFSTAASKVADQHVSSSSNRPADPEVLALPGFERPTPPESLRPPTTGSFRPFVPAAQAATLHAHLPQNLPSLQELIRDCRQCSLCKTRTQTVFADGTPKARLLLVGEAPGRDEDLQGLPFVGRAGQLLNKMLAAIQLNREDVYICNVLK